VLVPCKECGNEISDKAYTCPNCGNPNLKSKLEGAVSLGLAKAKSLNVPAKTKDVSAKSKIKIKEYNTKARAAVAEHQNKVDLGPAKNLLSSFFTKLFIILLTLILCWLAFIYQQDAWVPFNTIEGLSYTIKKLFSDIHLLLNNPATLGNTTARLVGILIIPVGLGVLIAKGCGAKKPKYYGFLLGCYIIFPILLTSMASNKGSLDAENTDIASSSVSSAPLPIADGALTEELTVGSCPSKIIVERTGEWGPLSNDLDTVRKMKSNPNRTNSVAAAYFTADNNMEVIVLSLLSLEDFQGGINESDFNFFRSEMEEAFKEPSLDMKSKINKVIEGNLSGTGAAGSHLNYEVASSSPGMFIGSAITEMDIQGSETQLYETAMKMQHIRGCVVQANFSIAVSEGSRDRLNQGISDFVMR